MQKTLITSGDIAKLLNTGVQKVRHILNTREDIRPIGKAGIVHIYDGAAVGQVQTELDHIEARRKRSEAQ